MKDQSSLKTKSKWKFVVIIKKILIYLFIVNKQVIRSSSKESDLNKSEISDKKSESNNSSLFEEAENEVDAEHDLE